MRIDRPTCNLKTCRHCFDGNCLDKKAYSRCPYKNPWIPVEAGPPKNDEAVLISHMNGVTKAWWNGRFWSNALTKRFKTVEAWMPLPDKYVPHKEG